MATRVKLTPHQKRQTPQFKVFEQSAAGLNHFYWTFRGSLEFTLPAMASVDNVTDLIKGNAGQKLNITASAFTNSAPTALRTARHSFLVLSVTIFEEYLRSILESTLVKTWKVDKTYKVSFRPQDLPADLTLLDFLRDRAIQATVDEVLGKPYSSRFDSVCALIESCGVPKPSLRKDLKDLATAACEARNCIVHAAGQVDRRASSGLAPFIPGLAVGSSLDIEEPLLWNFLASLRDAARVIDVAVRPIQWRSASKPRSGAR